MEESRCVGENVFHNNAKYLRNGILEEDQVRGRVIGMLIENLVLLAWSFLFTRD